MLEIVALIVLGVLVIAAIALVVVIGRIPGDIARRANHSQAEAINLLAWFGLLFGGLGWVLALIWSKTRPFSLQDQAVDERIAKLEQRLAALEGGDS